MHKRIVKAVQFVLNTSTIGNQVRIKVNEQKTGGFWSMKIICPKHLSKSIEELGLMIGRLNGEGLGTEITQVNQNEDAVELN